MLSASRRACHSLWLLFQRRTEPACTLPGPSGVSLRSKTPRSGVPVAPPASARSNHSCRKAVDSRAGAVGVMSADVGSAPKASVSPDPVTSTFALARGTHGFPSGSRHGPAKPAAAPRPVTCSRMLARRPRSPSAASTALTPSVRRRRASAGSSSDSSSRKLSTTREGASESSSDWHGPLGTGRRSVSQVSWHSSTQTVTSPAATASPCVRNQRQQVRTLRAVDADGPPHAVHGQAGVDPQAQVLVDVDQEAGDDPPAVQRRAGAARRGPSGSAGPGAGRRPR